MDALDDHPEIISFRPRRYGNHRGWLDFRYAGIEFFNASVYLADGELRLSLPRAPSLGADRRHRQGDDGRLLYTLIVKFEDIGEWHGVRGELIEALQRDHAEALA
jgi:hypothetical protein